MIRAAVDELPPSLPLSICHYGKVLPQKAKCYICPIHRRSAIIQAVHWAANALACAFPVHPSVQPSWKSSGGGASKDGRQRGGLLSVLALIGQIYQDLLLQPPLGLIICESMSWKVDWESTENNFKASLENLSYYSHISPRDQLDQVSLFIGGSPNHTWALPTAKSESLPACGDGAVLVRAMCALKWRWRIFGARYLGWRYNSDSFYLWDFG